MGSSCRLILNNMLLFHERRLNMRSQITTRHKWDYCFIEDNQEILLDLADFTMQEQPEDNLMVAIAQTWYNGSYTMAAKPMKSLELHHTMIQFFVHFVCTTLHLFSSSFCRRPLRP